MSEMSSSEDNERIWKFDLINKTIFNEQELLNDGILVDFVNKTEKNQKNNEIPEFIYSSLVYKLGINIKMSSFSVQKPSRCIVGKLSMVFSDNTTISPNSLLSSSSDRMIEGDEFLFKSNSQTKYNFIASSKIKIKCVSYNFERKKFCFVLKFFENYGSNSNQTQINSSQSQSINSNSDYNDEFCILKMISSPFLVYSRRPKSQKKKMKEKNEIKIEKEEKMEKAEKKPSENINLENLGKRKREEIENFEQKLELDITSNSNGSCFPSKKQKFEEINKSKKGDKSFDEILKESSFLMDKIIGNRNSLLENDELAHFDSVLVSKFNFLIGNNYNNSSNSNINSNNINNNNNCINNGIIENMMEQNFEIMENDYSCQGRDFEERLLKLDDDLDFNSSKDFNSINDLSLLDEFCAATTTPSTNNI